MRALTVLLAAEEAAGARVLDLVAKSPHRLTGVCTSSPAVEALSAEAGVPVHDAGRVTEAGFAEQAEVDLLLNVHSLHIVHTAVLTAPRLGAFNLHPGPLPEYAGLSVPSWAIYNGERSHGVTVHRMEADVDAGDVAFAERFDIGERDTGLTVSVTATRLGVPLVGRLLEAAADGHVPATPQDSARRRWYPRSGPHDGRLPWALPARRIADLVRASDYAPFPSPWGTPGTRAAHGELEVMAASATGERAAADPGTVVEARGESVAVAAADELVLVTRVRAGGDRVPPTSVLTPGETLDPGPVLPAS